MSSRAPLKVSGLISAGRVVPDATSAPSNKFDLPQRTTAAASDLPAPGEEFEVRIDQLDDSPFQAIIRRVLDPIRVDERAQSLKASGQATPVTVRRKPDGRYELIKGHYRKHGAKSIGWEVLRALLVVADDQEAKRQLMLDNESVTPSEYSYAHMFAVVRNDRISAGLSGTQKDIANYFGCSQAKVSNCLAMLELPAPLLAALDKKPSLFGAAAAKVLTKLWEELPSDQDLILTAVDGLADDEEESKAKQSELKKTVDQLVAERRKKAAKDQPAPQKPPKQQPRRVSISSHTGEECYVTILKENSINIDFKDKSIDPSLVQETINKALRDLVEKSKPQSNG